MNSNYVLLITSDTLGKGDEILGEKLLAAYLHTLTEGEQLPSHILLLNLGVKLAVEETAALESLKSLQDKGVDIYACGTCLDFYGIKDLLKIGKIGNMYLTRDVLAQAGKVISLT